MNKANNLSIPVKDQLCALRGGKYLLSYLVPFGWNSGCYGQLWTEDATKLDEEAIVKAAEADFLSKGDNLFVRNGNSIIYASLMRLCTAHDIPAMEVVSNVVSSAATPGDVTILGGGRSSHSSSNQEGMFSISNALVSFGDSISENEVPVFYMPHDDTAGASQNHKGLSIIDNVTQKHRILGLLGKEVVIVRSDDVQF